MNRTKIPWTDFTWNIITGCLGPHGTPSLPGRCPYCYAHRLARGRLKNLYLNNLGEVPAEPDWDFENVIPGGDPNDPFTPRYWPNRAIEPYKLKKPSKIFVCSMGELFGDFIPDDWINNVLDTCFELPEHIFQILTQNPKRAEHFHFPDNVWLGVTVTSPFYWSRVPRLLRANAKVKFVSFEPLLEDASNVTLEWVDWIIIGAQTRPTVLPKHDWVYRIIDRAHHAGIPIFLKPNLHWPERIQEFPSKLTLRRKVETNPQISRRIPVKSGESSQGYLLPAGSPNDKILSQSQGQHSDKTGGAK